MKWINYHFAVLLLFCSALNSSAAYKLGFVYCDKTTNGVIDSGDFPLESVMIVVTNVSGTFSNASWTSADGFFVVGLPDAPDHYVDYIQPGTFPAGTVVLPAFNSFQITANQLVVTNSFLVQNLPCASLVPVFKYGHVYCDANTNRLIDSGDLPVQSALVVVTNVSGTFSNASWTTADGAFLVDLPNRADTYVDYVLPATLPDGTTAVLPAVSTFVVTNSTSITNNFLIENPVCAVSSPPPFKIGHVYCDANSNGRIDDADVPVVGVLVVVTNVSQTFSNAAHTDAKGFFSIPLPLGADQYGDYLVASSLSAGTTIVVPGTNHVSHFSIPTLYPSNIITNDFLVHNLGCVTSVTNTGQCWLIGSGTIKTNKGKTAHSFSGQVNPCKLSTARQANWSDSDFTQKLHFKALTIQVVDCGNVPGHNGSTAAKPGFSFIEFQGTGTLKGMGKNKANHGTVQFFAHAEDLGTPGRKTDRLYLRVFDAAGNTLLLISGDAANPLNVAPATISTGNLQIHPCK